MSSVKSIDIKYFGDIDLPGADLPKSRAPHFVTNHSFKLILARIANKDKTLTRLHVDGPSVAGDIIVQADCDHFGSQICWRPTKICDDIKITCVYRIWDIFSYVLLKPYYQNVVGVKISDR